MRAHRSILRIALNLILFVTVGSLGSLPLPARAEIGELRSLAREIRFALHDHGRELSRSQRVVVRDELLASIRETESATGHRADAGPTLIGLATAEQRLLESNRKIPFSTQRRVGRRLARAAYLCLRRE